MTIDLVFSFISRHVEKSNMILEQRNDSFKESFHQSQARSLQLEQDKVELTQKLRFADMSSVLVSSWCFRFWQ